MVNRDLERNYHNNHNIFFEGIDRNYRNYHNYLIAIVLRTGIIIIILEVRFTQSIMVDYGNYGNFCRIWTIMGIMGISVRYGLLWELRGFLSRK